MDIKLFGRKVFEITRETSTLADPKPWLIDMLGGVETNSGIRINERKAMKVSAVYGCVNVLADTLAIFPKSIYEKVSERQRREDNQHGCYRLLKLEPNEFYTSFDFFHAMMVSVTLWGNAFAYIWRDSKYRVTALQFIHPEDITIMYEKVETSNGHRYMLAYRWRDMKNIIPPRDMIHVKGLGFDGIQGQGVVSYFAKESMGLSVAVEQFGAKFFGKDTILTKYLAHPGTLGPKARAALEASWNDGVAGLSHAYEMKILEEGMELKNVTIPPEQSQFLQTRQLQIEEICRWFKVPPHMIQHLLRSTNNNIEHQGIEFSIYTMIPWATRFEQELSRKLLAEDEKDDKYVKFNMNVLLRGDIRGRTQYYRTGRQWGWLSANDVLEKEDENGIGEQGDKYLTPMNMTDAGAEDSGRPQGSTE